MLMFLIKNKDIKMHHGDFGLQLPMTITNVQDNDEIVFEIYTPDGDTIIRKTLPNIDEKFIFELTEEESHKLEEKTYNYKLIQYRNNIMQNTLNNDSLFEII